MKQDDVLQAESILIGACGDPRCRCVHLQFVDDREEVFAQAVIHLAEVPGIIDDFQRVAYQIAATKDERQ